MSECINKCEMKDGEQIFEDVYGNKLCRKCLLRSDVYLIDGVVRKDPKTARKAIKEGKEIKGIPDKEEYEMEQEEQKNQEITLEEVSKANQESAWEEQNEFVDNNEREAPEEDEGINPEEKVEELEVSEKVSEESRIKEIVKEFEKNRKEEEENEELVAVSEDGTVTDIIGKITDIRELSEGYAEITVEDIDGGEHDITVTGKKFIWTLFYRTSPKKYINGMRAFWDELSDEEREEEIEAVCSKDENYLFRTEFDEETGIEKLYTMKSLRWRKLKVEEIQPLVEQILPEHNIIRTPSTGKHGGKLSIDLSNMNNEIIDTSVVIDGNDLDGFHSMTLHGHGMILACKNQMLLETSKIVEDIPKFSFGSRSVHAGSVENLVEKLLEVKIEVEAFSSWIEKAKDISLTVEQTDKILDFYLSHKMISGKVKAIICEYFGNEEVEQVPGTLWGLAMIVTYAGTHHEKLSKGVRKELARIGGELLIMAEYFDKFMSMVEERYEEMEEKRKEAEAKAEEEREE